MFCCVVCLSVSSEEDEESDGVASNQSAEDGSVNENTNNYSNNGSIGTCMTQVDYIYGFSFKTYVAFLATVLCSFVTFDYLTLQYALYSDSSAKSHET